MSISGRWAAVPSCEYCEAYTEQVFLNAPWDGLRYGSEWRCSCLESSHTCRFWAAVTTSERMGTEWKTVAAQRLSERCWGHRVGRGLLGAIFYLWNFVTWLVILPLEQLTTSKVKVSAKTGVRTAKKRKKKSTRISAQVLDQQDGNSKALTN